MTSTRCSRTSSARRSRRPATACSTWAARCGPAEFLERIEETGGRMVIVFAEMLSAAHSVVRVREMFESAGRDDVIVFVAGAPFVADAKLAKSVGANGVVRGAESALKLLAKAAKRSSRRRGQRRERPQPAVAARRGSRSAGPRRAGRRRGVPGAAVRRDRSAGPRAARRPVPRRRLLRRGDRLGDARHRDRSRSARRRTCASGSPTTATAGCGTSRSSCGTSSPRSCPTS